MRHAANSRSTTYLIACASDTGQRPEPGRGHDLPGRLWQEQPQAGQPSWLVPGDVTLTAVSGLSLCDESFACYVLWDPAW